MNGARLSALSGELKSIANPKFNWNPGLKAVDDLTSKIQKGKLSISEYFNTFKNGQNQIISQQMRLQKAFAEPLGKGGQGMAMTIPSAAQINPTITAAEKLNTTMAVQGELLSGLGTKIQDWGKNTQWAGRQMTVGLTMPLAMAAAAAGKYAYDIDQSLTRIEKVYDGSTQGLRDMATSAAMAITQTLGTSVKSSLDTMAELAAAGKQGKDMIDLATQAQRISVLGNVDQESSIKSVISMQAIYQQSTADVAKAVNYLNYVDSQTPTSMGEIIDAIPIAGATVAQLGGTLKDTTVLLTAFKERGISTTEGANAIKTAMNRILSPTKATKDLFEQLTGKSLPDLVKSTQGKPLETFQALSDAIVGSNLALDDQQRLISKLSGIYQSSRITGLLQGLQDKNGAVAKTKEISAISDQELAQVAKKHQDAITNSASGQFRIAVESFKAQLKTFGDTALKIATSVVQGFGKILSIFNGLPEPIKMAVVAIGGLLAIAGPITMLVGLFGNLIGSAVKFGGFLLSMASRTKTMTVEQKAAQIAAGQMKTGILSEADAAQILVFQMDKLVGALSAVDVQSKKTAATMEATASKYNGIKTLSATQVIQHPTTGELVTNTGKPLSETDKAYANQQLLNREKKQTQQLEENIADDTQKSSKYQKIFSSEALIGVSAVTGIASAAMDGDGAFAKWLQWISLGSLALTGIIPIIEKIGKTAVANNIMSALTSAGSSVGGKLSGFTSKLGSGIKAALTSSLSVLSGPVGLGLGALVAGVAGIITLEAQQSKKVEESHQNILKSTDMWANSLGRAKLEWGQMETSSGKVKSDVESMVDKLNEGAKPLVDSFKSVSDINELKWMSNVQVGNLQGQGLNKNEIEINMRALLTAAGKTKDQIEQIMSNINVTFDFQNGEKDFDGFIGAMKKKVDALGSDLFNSNNVNVDEAGLPSLSQKSQDNMARQTDELKQMFMDRAASMSDVDRAVFAKKFVDSMTGVYEQAFQQLNTSAGGQLGKNFQEAQAKFLKFDKGSWGLSNEGLGLDPQTGQKLLNIATEEQGLAVAIARARGASDDQVKSISDLNGIIPFVTQNLGSAQDVQKSYNDAVKQAEDSGHKMTDAEKQKLAAVYASVSGLDAAKLAANGYSQSVDANSNKVRENAAALQRWVGDLKNAANASDDAWQEMSQGGTDQGSGFGGPWQSILGDTSTAQAQSLTDKIKGIYSGTMDSIYDSYAGAAQDVWQKRLDAITASFEKKKNDVQAQMDAFDKTYNQKQQDFQDRWDAIMNNTKQAYSDRQKAIENEAQAQLDSIDAQIKSIQDQQQAEQDLEDARKKQFEAEKTRIERMSQLANNRIDYNKALYGGNLDEAARVQNNSEAQVLGWSIDDANSRADDAASKKSKLSDTQIKQLQSTKDLVTQQKQAKLDALKEEEDALEKSLDRQRTLEQRAMENARDIERQRLQDRLDSLNKEQQATESAERKKQQMNQQTLEIQLATLKAFIPQNEQQLNDHINRVGGAYGQFGITLQGAGGQWGQIVGNALQNNVDRARTEMSSDANWAAFGASVANAISQGAFGLNLNDFMNLLRTGNPPPGWAPPAPLSPTKDYFRAPNSRVIARHAGGPVDGSLGSRNARGNSPLGSDEYMSVLQRGEFVIDKGAVQTFGTENLSRINAGAPSNIDPGVSLAGMGGAFAGIMASQMAGAAVHRLADFYASQNASVAAALGYMGQGLFDAINFAQAQDGKPYIWGASGPNGYDCSGYMSAIADVLTGMPMYQRIFATGQMSPGKAKGPFLPGPGGPFEIGVKTGAPGHTAGTLNGVNVESTGNHVRYGKDAHGSRDKQFNMLFHVPPEFVSGGGFGGAGGGGAVKETVRAVAQKYGWESGIMWDSLDWLIQHESSWNPTNQNPKSTAYGLFQFLDSTWAQTGIGKTADVRLQAEAGMRYISQRYTNPIGAKNFWASHRWYDQGGEMPPGVTMAYNGTNMTESVLTNGTTRGVIRALENANYTYSGFKGILSDALSVVAQPGLNGLDSAGGDTYQFGDINIDGSGLSAKELKQVISDTIDEKTKLAKKKRGVIK